MFIKVMNAHCGFLTGYLKKKKKLGKKSHLC